MSQYCLLYKQTRLSIGSTWICHVDTVLQMSLVHHTYSVSDGRNTDTVLIKTAKSPEATPCNMYMQNKNRQKCKNAKLVYR